MFTGITQAVGTIATIEPHGEDRRVVVNAGTLDLGDVALGDSISVSGVCLSVVDISRASFSADISAETLATTTFSTLHAGDRVNLEKALTLTTRLGGHLVCGHVDGVGTVAKRWSAGRSLGLRLRPPADLGRYIATKGSVCIDGISLTVNAVSGAEFDVNIVPHTLRQTTLGDLGKGQRVNLEVDIVARYVERLLQYEEQATDTKLTPEFLAEHGFIHEP